MAVEKIIADLKKKHFKPVYWLEGDEDYFIDTITDYAATSILNESEAGFNLTILYGRDTDWPQLFNVCRKYPMFAERQVVILKEAQEMKDILKLESYVEKPLSSTLLFVAYKGKKIDGRSRLSKLLKEKAVLYTTKKLWDNQLPEWVAGMVKSKSFSITHKAQELLIDHIGNDLNRLNNEIDKIILNAGSSKTINEDMIERFVGISKEFNVFELQRALAHKDFYKAMRIVQYFESNPKAAPIQLILPSLYNFFSKTLLALTVPAGNEAALSTVLGIKGPGVRDYALAAQHFGQSGVEKALLLLHHYNLRSVGIGDPGNNDASLLKELMGKLQWN